MRSQKKTSALTHSTGDNPKMKGMSTMTQVIVGVGILAVIGGGVIGAFMLTNQGTAVGEQPATPQKDTKQADQKSQADAKFSGRFVKLKVETSDLSGNKVTSGTIYLFKDKPENWGDASAIQNDYSNADSTYSIDSDGVTTIQETPQLQGDYYMAVQHSGAYPVMTQLSIPTGENYQSVALSEYNQAPELERVEVSDKASISSATFDLGVTQNATDVEVFDSNTFSPAENTEYRLDYLVVEDGSVPTTSDSDTDGTYDEGVHKFTVDISGAVEQTDSMTETVFNPSNGVNELDNDGKTKVQVDRGTQDYLTFNRDNRLTIEATAQADLGGTTAQTGDEELSDGENVFDITLFGTSGSTSPTMPVTG